MEFEIAKITSVPLTRFDGQEGQFELSVMITLDEILASGDPWGFVKHVIGKHLAMCVKSAGIPLGEKAWLVEFSPFCQRNFDVPPTAVM